MPDTSCMGKYGRIYTGRELTVHISTESKKTLSLFVKCELSY